jgi:hypothetical protein
MMKAGADNYLALVLNLMLTRQMRRERVVRASES